MRAMHYQCEVTEHLTYEMLDRLSDVSNNLNWSCLTVLRNVGNSLVFGVFGKEGNLTVDTYLCPKDSMFYERFSKLVGESDKEFYYIVSIKMVSSIKTTLVSHKLSLADELLLFPPSYSDLYGVYKKRSLAAVKKELL